MFKRHVAAIMLGAAVFAATLSGTAVAIDCGHVSKNIPITPPGCFTCEPLGYLNWDVIESGDAFVWSWFRATPPATESQARIDEMWSKFGFRYNDWVDKGYWYYHIDAPLARTYHGMQVLAFGVTKEPHCNYNANNFAEWAYCYAWKKIAHIEGKCDGAGSSARTWKGPAVTDRTELYKGFYYGEHVNVVTRASYLVHEARHAEGCNHIEDNKCNRHGSCDNHFAVAPSGCAQGANTFEVIWINWLASTYRPERISPYLVHKAVAIGNLTLNDGFWITCWIMAENGTLVRTCN